ncbi:ATP-binding protein [Caldanaerobacter sp.]|uniref:ATP-binding protein n=1 Tax=Caldanaerobacter sp. TaxID=2930036 RepID=UPI003C75FE79
MKSSKPSSTQKNSLQWISNLLDNAHDFFVLKDLKGKVVHINTRLLDVLGYTHDDVEDYDYFFHNVLKYKEIGPYEEGLIIELTGKYNIRMSFGIKFSPITNTAGEKIAYLGFVKLRDYAKGHFAYPLDLFKASTNVLEVTEEGVIVVDGKFNVVYVNNKACELFGIKYAKFVNAKFLDLVKKFKPDFSEISLLRGEKIVIPSQDGNEERILLLKYGKLMNNHWKIIIAKDITEDLRYKKLMEQTERYTIAGEFAANTIHEIKNSLTSIKGFIQLLQVKHPESFTYYETILDEVDRVLGLIRNYLGIVKTSEEEEEEKEIDVNAIIDQYILLFEAEMLKKGIKFKKKFGEIPLMKIDKNHIKQLILNIVQNAMHAVGDNGKIVLSTKYSPYLKKLILRIADNGGGIDRKYLKRVVEPLFTTKKDGTGLGLAICKSIAEMYNGDLKIYSKKGKGTLVKVVLGEK